MVTNPARMDEAVGGIGIVFDSEPQFKAMLHDSLPRDERGAVVQGCFGIFADRGRTIIPGAHSFVVGKIFYHGETIPVVDIRQELRLQPKEIDMETQIIVAQAGSSKVGLLVDALGEIPEVFIDRVEMANGLLDSQENYVECVVKPETNTKDVNMLVILDPERLVRHLVKGRAGRP